MSDEITINKQVYDELAALRIEETEVPMDLCEDKAHLLYAHDVEAGGALGVLLDGWGTNGSRRSMRRRWTATHPAPHDSSGKNFHRKARFTRLMLRATELESEHVY